MNKVLRTPLFIAIVMLSVSILFTACNKDNDDIGWPDAAVLTVVHGSPMSPRLDFALDSNRLRLYNFSYTKYLYNQLAYTGNRTLSVYKYGEDIKLLNKQITLEKDKNYTLFIVDSLQNIDAVLLQNATRSAEGDSVRIKFANMCPDVASMDFYIKGDAAPFATNVSYKDAADFMSVKAGYDQVIEVTQAGQTAVLAASLPINLSRGNIYTIWTSGFKGIATGEGIITVSTIKHTRPPGYWH
ncbi:MAG: DUF4397 domain-containing protein [Niabella sp.]